MKNKTLKKVTRHHKLPQSRNGSSHADNIRAIEQFKHRALHILYDNALPHEQILQVIQQTGNAFNEIFVEKLLDFLDEWIPEQIYNNKCYKRKILGIKK